MNHKLLVAVEGGMESLETVLYAARACAGQNGPRSGAMVILHVLPPLPPSVESSEVEATRTLAARLSAENKRAAEIRLKELKTRAVQEGVAPESVQIEIAEDSDIVLEQILRAASAHGCDTVVVGRRGQSLLREFLAGSVVERLLWKPIGFAVWIVEHPSHPAL